jgi:hypothetical protein
MRSYAARSSYSQLATTRPFGFPPACQPSSVTELDREQVGAEEVMEDREIFAHSVVDAHPINHGAPRADSGDELVTDRYSYAFPAAASHLSMRWPTRA